MNEVLGGEDDALMARYAAGDRAAARLLTQRLLPVALAHAQRLLGDRAEAEDVAQEAMLRLWRIAPKWEPGRARVTTWLYRVVGNLVTDRLRKSRPEPMAEPPETADMGPTAEERLIARDRAVALQAALMTLPDRQRQAVVLRHIEGLPVPDVAEALDVSVHAAESLLARGRRALTGRLATKKGESDGTS